MNTTKYLETFFNEKQIGYVMWDLEVDDEVHIIDNETVIETILSGTVPESELRTIANTIRKIDFLNGDINHYLRHLAECMVRTMAA